MGDLAGIEDGTPSAQVDACRLFYEGFKKECDNCKKAGTPGRYIFFVDTGRKKPNGKIEWELREPISQTESKVHEHVGSGNFKRKWTSAPVKDVDGVVLLKLTPDPVANGNLIAAVKGQGYKVNRLKDGAIQILQKTDGDYLVMVHEVAG